MSNQLSVKGHVVHIGQLQQLEKITKREFVIQTPETYPQMVKFECVGDKTQILDGISLGMEVDVFFNLRGRKWNENYYTSLQAWRIVADSNTNQKPTKTLAEEMANDDLPF
jgi:single-strand DNA-binding protein